MKLYWNFQRSGTGNGSAKKSSMGSRVLIVQSKELFFFLICISGVLCLFSCVSRTHFAKKLCILFILCTCALIGELWCGYLLEHDSLCLIPVSQLTP